MDKYLQDIVRDKRYWENKRQNIRLKEKQLEELTARYAQNLEQIDKERKEYIAKARQEARSLLAETNARIENTIRTIKEAQASKEATKEARKKLEEYKAQLQDENVPNSHDKIEHEIKKLRGKQRHKNTKNNVSERNSETTTAADTPIAIGDAVRIKGESTIGEVIELGAKEATVAFGLVQSKIKLDRIEKTDRKKTKKQQYTKIDLYQRIDIRRTCVKNSSHLPTK